MDDEEEWQRDELERLEGDGDPIEQAIRNNDRSEVLKLLAIELAGELQLDPDARSAAAHSIAKEIRETVRELAQIGKPKADKVDDIAKRRRERRQRTAS